MSSSFRLAVLAASLTIAVPVVAQTAVEAPQGEPDKAIEGDTPERVALVNACGDHKFEAMVEIDPVKHRSTRVKLCSKPGATDAEWVTTLNAAIAQMEVRTMPPAARDQLIAQLQAEAARFDQLAASKSAAIGLSAIDLGKGSFDDSVAEPEAPFMVTSLPPLPNPKGRATATAATAAKSPAVLVKPIRASIKCLTRGESGKGGSCDYFDKNTVLVLTAIAGLDDGATVRFLRKGEDRGTVEIGSLGVGDMRRIPLPPGICKNISYSKIEIELIAPKTTMAGGRLGPYGLRC